MDEGLYRLHAEREDSYWWWVAKNRIILSLIERYSPRRAGPSASELRGRALDIGCGAGAVLRALSESYDSVGVDMSPLAREYCARRGFLAVDGMLPDGLPAEICRPASFDVIVASEVIEHVTADAASVSVLCGLLKPGGIIVCTVPAHMWLWSSHDDFNEHKRRYTSRALGKLFENAGGMERLILSEYQCVSMPLVAGARMVEKVRTRLTGKSPAEPSVRPLPGVLNTVLTKAFDVERFVLPWMNLPWGSSVICVYRRLAS